MIFEDGKTESLNLRVSPSFKSALRALADSENRSMVNMLEVLLSEKLKKRSAPMQTARSASGRKP